MRVRERILAVLLAHRHRLASKTLMERLIPLEKARLTSVIAAYRLYCQFHRLPQPEIRVHVDRRRKLPTIPPGKTLQASIVVPRRFKWQVYFKLLYECGARPSEPFSLTPPRCQAFVGKELTHPKSRYYI